MPHDDKTKHLNAKDGNEEEGNLISALDDGTYQSFRSSRISVTVYKNSDDTKWGIGLQPKNHEEPLESTTVSNENEDGETQKAGAPDGVSADQNNDISLKEMEEEIVEIAAFTQSGLLGHAPILVGDVVESINNKPCKSVADATEELLNIPQATYATIVFKPPIGNPNLIQAVVTKPTPSAVLGVRFLQMKRPSQAQCEVDASNETDKNTNANQTILQINHVASKGLLGQSVLKAGDIVLAINGVPCSHLSDEEAAELVRQAPKDVSIVAWRAINDEENLTRKQRIIRGAKRAGVAVGGGAMVGVGLIFIPTLPPPFGEVLILGGVSLLSTEFEGPKRVMRSARDGLGNAVGPAQQGEQSTAATKTTSTTECIQEDNAKIGTDEKEQDSSACPPEEDSKNSKQQTRTLRDRFKNFGRNVVLPFLDQVVGDKHQNSPPKPEEAPDQEGE